jgi:hypothetical protein
MRGLFLFVGIAMSLASARFGLDASSHMPAAVATAGLAIGSGLCFVASAINRRAGDPPNPALSRTLATGRAFPGAEAHRSVAGSAELCR